MGRVESGSDALVSRVSEQIQKVGIGALRVMAIAAGAVVLSGLDQISIPSSRDDFGIDILSQLQED